MIKYFFIDCFFVAIFFHHKVHNGLFHFAEYERKLYLYHV